MVHNVQKMLISGRGGDVMRSAGALHAPGTRPGTRLGRVRHAPRLKGSGAWRASPETPIEEDLE